MKQHIVMPTKLNVRANSGKDEANTILGVLPKRTIVEEIDALSDRSWLKIKSGNLTGWVSNDFLLPSYDAKTAPWLDFAYNEFGVAEIAGDDKSNSRIEQYHHSITAGSVSGKDDVAWCSSFTNWCVENTGIKTQPTITRSARSWAKFGAKTTTPGIGSIVVFWRRPSKKESAEQSGWTKEKLMKSGSYGHVGFFVEMLDNRVIVYGGNQSSSMNPSGEVCKKAYPIDSENYGVVTFIKL